MTQDSPMRDGLQRALVGRHRNDRPRRAVPLEGQARRRRARGGLRLADSAAGRLAEAVDRVEPLALGRRRVGHVGNDRPLRAIPGLDQVLAEGRARLVCPTAWQNEAPAHDTAREEATDSDGGRRRRQEFPHRPVPQLAEGRRVAALHVVVPDRQAPARVTQSTPDAFGTGDAPEAGGGPSAATATTRSTDCRRASRCRR